MAGILLIAIQPMTTTTKDSRARVVSAFPKLNSEKPSALSKAVRMGKCKIDPNAGECVACEPAAHAEKADTVTVQRARGAMTTFVFSIFYRFRQKICEVNAKNLLK